MVRKMIQTILIILVVVVVILTFLLYRMGVASRSMQVASGHDNGQLLDCPATPNCVSSQAPVADSHYIAPLELVDGNVWEALETALATMKGAVQVKREENYAYYTFQTALMGFVDDVEFLKAEDEGLIHVRSASRVGRSDMNANRTRIEEIRSQL